MVQKMQIDDNIRLNILDALFEKNCLEPNIKNIQRITKYNKNTIKASLNFLKDQGAIKCFEPLIDVAKYGMKERAMTLISVDMAKKKELDKALNLLQADPNTILIFKLTATGKWNYVLVHLLKDMQEYYDKAETLYYSKLPFIKDLNLKQEIIYEREMLKNVSASKSTMNILKKEGKFR